jgi:hypothetical protein
MIYDYNNIYAPEPSIYRVPMVKVHLKVGTHSSSVWLVRKADLKNLKPQKPETGWVAQNLHLSIRPSNPCFG